MKIDEYKDFNIKGENPVEINVHNSFYLHTSDDEYDYLYCKEREKGVKITLKFTKDVERRNKAIDALKIFFSQL